MTKQYHRHTDEELIGMIQEGAQSHLFGILYHRYYDKVYRKCMGFARDTEAAQDMAQDVLLKAFNQLSKFKGNSRFSTWLYAVTYNFCVEYYRKSSKYTSIDIENGPDLPENDDTHDAEMLQSRVQQLHSALGQIPAEDRDLLLQKYQEDVPIRDLMERLDISESAIKMRLLRARSRVKELITASENYS